MEKIEYKGSVSRIRKCAFDIFSLQEDFIGDDCSDNEWWDFFESDLRLRSTFLYCDLYKVVSNIDDDERREAFTNLANKLFCYFEQLDNAVKSHSVVETKGCYGETMLVLQEVVAALNPADGKV